MQHGAPGNGHQANGNGNGNGHGQSSSLPEPLAEVRSIDIDLSDLELPADLPSLDDLALAAANIYERFVPYADDGWEWLTFPGSRDFDGWLYSDPLHPRHLTGARLLCRKVADEPAGPRPGHGVSAHRTRQLTERPWTAAPGSKLWQPFR
jgi:hypothetical protein